MIEKEQNLINDILKKISYPNTLLLDMRKIVKHWYLDYNYHVIRPDYKFDDLKFETCLKKSSFQNSSNFYQEINEYVSASLRLSGVAEFEPGKAMVIAWCSDVVEKDGVLFYAYDINGTFKGIYSKCIVMSDEIIRVGNSLSDFFDLEQTISGLSEKDPVNNDVYLKRKKISKEKLITYEDLLDYSEYRVLDGEFGEASFDHYKNYIDTTIIPLTCNELKYEKLICINVSDRIRFDWLVDGKSFSFDLENNTDWIDGIPFYTTLNLILEHIGTQKRLVSFRDTKFGQDYGLAYIDNNKTFKLEQLFDIESINKL